MPAALALSEIGDTATIKISKQRQITIPSAACKKYGFDEYALCTLTEEGILIQPIEPADKDEDLTYELMRWLVEKGYEGNELLAKYEEVRPKFLSFHRKIREAEEDIAAGRVTSMEAIRAEIRDRYGI